MHQITSYFKFLWRSTNQHGIHSPFVYQLVTRCFYDKKRYPSYKILKEYRRRLLNDHSEIEVSDLGAGSRVFTSGTRKISDISRNAGTSRNRARLLNRLVPYLQVENALELGASVGIGTCAIAAGNQVRVLSLEGCSETASVARRYLKNFDFENVEIRTGKFEDSLSLLNTDTPLKFDLIFFDGNHQKQPTLEYFQQLLPLAHNDSVFIFDDIHWSKDMEEAWKEIKAHPAVQVSIDTFQWGMIFFRQEQEKQHFHIRI